MKFRDIMSGFYIWTPEEMKMKNSEFKSNNNKMVSSYNFNLVVGIKWRFATHHII